MGPIGSAVTLTLSGDPFGPLPMPIRHRLLSAHGMRKSNRGSPTRGSRGKPLRRYSRNPARRRIQRFRSAANLHQAARMAVLTREQFDRLLVGEDPAGALRA